MTGVQTCALPIFAVRKEFDYSVPEALRDRVGTGTRVKVPFGHRLVTGLVTAIVEASPHSNLRAVDSVVGVAGVVTPTVLQLARWIASYYCCPVESALKSVLPDAVRKEDARWKERLHVSFVAPQGEPPKLSPRQREVLNILEEWREMPMAELVRLAGTTADTVRKLEEKGLKQTSDTGAIDAAILVEIGEADVRHARSDERLRSGRRRGDGLQREIEDDVGGAAGGQKRKGGLLGARGGLGAGLGRAGPRSRAGAPLGSRPLASRAAGAGRGGGHGGKEGVA